MTRTADQERRGRGRKAPPAPVDEPVEDELEEDELEEDELEEDELEEDELEDDELEDDELEEEPADDELEDEPEPAPEPEPEPPKKIPARQIARWAAEQVMEMTGKESESVTSVQRSDEGWTVGLEVVESRRIPDTADLMAIYEAEMDAEGELLSYRRLRQYTRGKGDGE